jgi:uncharacterized membrane protein YkoI
VSSTQAANHRWRHSVYAFFVALLLLGSGFAGADDTQDHDRARKAFEAGEILPLPAILERVAREFPGQVLDVELERENRGAGELWVYKVKVLLTGGSLAKFKFNARDGELIGRKSGKHR